MENKKLNFDNGFDLSSLSTYKDEMSGQLFLQKFFDTETFEWFSVMKGVKGTNTINKLNVNTITYGDDMCSVSLTNNNSAITFGQEDLVVNPIKAEGKFCADELRGFWAGYVRSDATSNEDMPFQEVIIEQIAKKIRSDIDTVFWQGDTDTAISSSILGAFDGMYNLLSGKTFESYTGSSLASTVSFTNIDTTVEEMMDLVNENWYNDEAGLTLFCSKKVYNTLRRKLIKTNLFDESYYVKDQNNLAFIHPLYSFLTVKAMIGMGTQQYMYIMPKDVAFIGTGGLYDSEIGSLNMEYDFKEDALIWRMKTLLGLQVAATDGYIVTNYDY